VLAALQHGFVHLLRVRTGASAARRTCPMDAAAIGRSMNSLKCARHWSPYWLVNTFCRAVSRVAASTCLPRLV
jgi:hypothetical protein